MNNLMLGIGSKREHVAAMLTFSKLMLKRAELFFFHEDDDGAKRPGDQRKAR